MIVNLLAYYIKNNIYNEAINMFTNQRAISYAIQILELRMQLFDIRIKYFENNASPLPGNKIKELDNKLCYLMKSISQYKFC